MRDNQAKQTSVPKRCQAGINAKTVLAEIGMPDANSAHCHLRNFS
jgi:hypothetical protein